MQCFNFNRSALDHYKPIFCNSPIGLNNDPMSAQERPLSLESSTVSTMPLTCLFPCSWMLFRTDQVLLVSVYHPWVIMTDCCVVAVNQGSIDINIKATVIVSLSLRECVCLEKVLLHPQMISVGLTFTCSSSANSSAFRLLDLVSSNVFSGQSRTIRERESHRLDIGICLILSSRRTDEIRLSRVLSDECSKAFSLALEVIRVHWKAAGDDNLVSLIGLC